MGALKYYAEIRTLGGGIETILRSAKDAGVKIAPVSFDPALFKRDFKGRVSVIVIADDDVRALSNALVSIKTTTAGWSVGSFELLVVDNGCGEFTREFLEDRNGLYDLRVVMEHKVPWAQAATVAAEQSSGNFLAFVAPGVVVFDGWLERMVDAAEKTGGIVSPMSSKHFPAFDGHGLKDAANRVARSSARECVRGMINPSCFVMQRRRLAGNGLSFATDVGPGHAAVWDLVMSTPEDHTLVATDVLVFDATPGPVGPKLPPEGSNLLCAKWGAKKVEDRLTALPDVVSSPKLAADTIGSTGRRVVFAFNEMVICGATLLAWRVCDQLNDLGWDACTAGTRLDPGHKKLMQSAFEPAIFDGDADMVRWMSNMNRGDILVAPLYYATEKVLRAAQENPGLKVVYYVQDDEARFVTNAGVPYVDGEAVQRSYAEFSNVVANSEWVAEYVKQIIGRQVPMICPGVDTLMFRPPDVCEQGPVSILAHSRTSTPRRGWDFISAVFRRVAQHRQVALYTYDEDPKFNHPSHLHLGRLSPQELAKVMRACDIFIEGSVVQGFGMQALEAMSSGMALVCTDNHGIDTFGTSGYDCVVVQYGDMETAAAVVLRLVDEPAERTSIGRNARLTASGFSWELVGKAWDEYLRSI